MNKNGNKIAFHGALFSIFIATIYFFDSLLDTFVPNYAWLVEDLILLINMYTDMMHRLKLTPK